MEYSFIIAVIPVILVVAFLVWIAKKITDGERIDMKEATLGVVILLVAVLIMVPMVTSTQTYTWDEDAGELTIKKNVSGGYYAWDEYAEEVKSLVIDDGVTIDSGAFDSLTSLEYVSIGTGSTIASGAFGITALDQFGDPVQMSPGIYVGLGDGTVYKEDASVFSTSTISSGIEINGLAEGAEGAVVLVIPSSIGGKPVKEIDSNAFQGNTTVEKVLSNGLVMEYIHAYAFDGCTAMEVFDVDAKLIGSYVFRDCSALSSFSAKSFTSIPNYAFKGCSALTAIDLTDVTSIGSYAFNLCESLTDVSLPAITTIGGVAFTGCTGITGVSFGSSLATVSSSSFGSWTFYATDGTTAIDRTDASALAGKAFQGTASALIEVAPGQLTLTPQQIQQVHLHDTELQDLKDQISIEPLPLQPSLQEQDLTA